MKAVVYTAPRRVEVADWPEPECGADEVLVRMRGVGLCGSDLTVYDGHRELPSLPWVMGHEGGGDVVAVGSAVTDRQVGQRVVVEPNYACLECAACRSGQTSQCQNRRIVGMNHPGVLAEQVCVPAAFTHVVPDDWPDERLAVFEPLVVARAAVRRARVRPDAACLVVGAGSQGLLVCLTLLAIGAQPYVSEPHEGRVALAEKLGARRADLDAETYPYAFETAGVAPAFGTALRGVARGGTITLIGLVKEPVPVDLTDVVRRGLTITGSIIYDHPTDFADTRDAVASGAVAPERAVHAGTPPDQAAQAFAEARTATGKSWIDLTQW